jgi:hypothetical protein
MPCPKTPVTTSADFPVVEKASVLCAARDAGLTALNDQTNAAIVEATKAAYVKITDLLKAKAHIDVNKIFEIVAVIIVLCWLQNWVIAIKDLLLVRLPNAIKNACRGKVDLCIFPACYNSFGVTSDVTCDLKDGCTPSCYLSH